MRLRQSDSHSTQGIQYLFINQVVEHFSSSLLKDSDIKDKKLHCFLQYH